MLETLSDPFPTRRSAIAEYYRRAVDALLPTLGGTPFVAVIFPRGTDQRPTFLGPLHHPPFHDAPTVDVESRGGSFTYLALAENTALWQIHRTAVELHSWMPTRSDPGRVWCARVLLEQPHPPDLRTLKAGARIVREVLHRRGLEAVVGLESAGLVLWVPFTDGPAYEDVRAWLHVMAAEALAGHPEVFSPHRQDGRVLIAVSSNAVGHWSPLPYSLRADAVLSCVTPVAWDALDAAAPATLATPPDFGSFGRLVGGIAQRFAALAERPVLLGVPGMGSHSHVVEAMRQLLDDGSAQSAEDLCAAGIARGLLPATTKVSYVENALRGLVERQTARGEKPDFVELVDGRFRLNRPVDPFPADRPVRAEDPALDALIARLRASATRAIPAEPEDHGNAGAPFEQAVADAFARLGFLAMRDGKHAAPDVVATAPLGATAYTVVIECKTLGGDEPHVQWVAASEASRFRDRIGADYAMLIGPQFPGDKPLDDELAQHRVALWTVEDLVTVLDATRWHPVGWDALVPLFAPGRAAERVAAFAFTHRHGDWQRARIALAYAIAEGAKYQASLSTADDRVERANAPLTVEALTILVNQRLAAEQALGRLSAEEVGAVLRFASSHIVEAARADVSGITIVHRALSSCQYT